MKYCKTEKESTYLIVSRNAALALCEAVNVGGVSPDSNNGELSHGLWGIIGDKKRIDESLLSGEVRNLYVAILGYDRIDDNSPLTKGIDVVDDIDKALGIFKKFEDEPDKNDWKIILRKDISIRQASDEDQVASISDSVEAVSLQFRSFQ